MRGDIHAGADVAVVALRAVRIDEAADARMVEDGRLERTSGMAVGAILVIREGRDVIRQLTHADHVVMTAVAATGDRDAAYRVVEITRRKRTR